jgi:hypothetical protein
MTPIPRLIAVSVFAISVALLGACGSASESAEVPIESASAEREVKEVCEKLANSILRAHEVSISNRAEMNEIIKNLQNKTATWEAYNAWEAFIVKNDKEFAFLTARWHEIGCSSSITRARSNK